MPQLPTCSPQPGNIGLHTLGLRPDNAEASSVTHMATFSFPPPQDDYEPGNLGFDPLGLKPTNAVAYKDMQTRELNNGRLAMIAIIAFWLQELNDPKHTSEWAVPAVAAGRLGFLRIWAWGRGQGAEQAGLAGRQAYLCSFALAWSACLLPGAC